MPGTAVERLPLSFNQELLCLFDAGDDAGPFGPRYHNETGLRLTGPLDQAALRVALADVVPGTNRCVATIVRNGSTRHQEVHPPSPPSLEVRDCPGLSSDERRQRAGELLAEVESWTISASELPLLRAVLLVFDERDAALVLLTHHLATDGQSLGIIARDLGACYAARLAGGTAVLPPLRPYREFVAWERDRMASETATAARQYWAATLRGARLTALRADHPRSAALPPSTAMYRFSIDVEIVTQAVRMARSARSSSFMVLLAAYYRLVSRLTGETDIVVSTHTPGRGDGRFDDTVGSFFNFVPLRVDLAECHDAGEVLRRTRTSCLGAYTNDIPAVQLFETAPELMETAGRDDFAPVTFQVLPHSARLDGSFTDDLCYAEIPRLPTSLPVVADIPDGALWTIVVDPAGQAEGDVAFRTDRFDERTIKGLVEDYRQELADLVR